MLTVNARLLQVAPSGLAAFLDSRARQSAGSADFDAAPRPARVLARGETGDVMGQTGTLAQVSRRDVDIGPAHLLARLTAVAVPTCE